MSSLSPALQKFLDRSRAIQSCLCVGLDADFNKLPERFLQQELPQFAFNQWIIEQTHEFAAAYKPNSAFYEARGGQGMQELKLTLQYLHENHPDIFLIDDAKRADIDSTNLGYVTAIFDELGFDAVTLHPYLGQTALAPFLDRADKVSIILCRTSNPGAGDLQDLPVGSQQDPLWKIVAQKVSQDWNTNNNCMLVVGATYPEELRQIRAVVGEEMLFLVPGVGAQGGSLTEALQAGANSKGEGLVINSARGIIFAENPRAEAQKLVEEYRAFLQTLSL